jgi:hypothetical protein
MKNKYPYNKPYCSHETYIDKLISLKKSMKDMKEMQDEAKEIQLKMSIMNGMDYMMNKKKR